MIAEIVAEELAAIHASMDVYNRSAYLSTATGGSLDMIGELQGVYRNKSMRAFSGESNFRFYIDPTQGLTTTDLINIVNDSYSAGVSSIVIRKGTLIYTSGGGISYSTTSDVTLTNGNNYVSVVSTGTGAEYNVGAGALIKHNIIDNQLELYPVAKYILCTNDEAIETGVSYETDANYRARIKEAKLEKQNANEVAVRNAALSVPGVADIIVTKYPEGIGTYGIVVMTEYPIASTHVLNGVREAVNQVASYGTRPIVSTPEYLAIELKIKLIFVDGTSVEEKDTIKRYSRASVIDYVNNIPVGGDFIVTEVIQRVMDSSDKIKDMTQQWFRVSKYSSERNVLLTGKGMTLSDTSQLQSSTGQNMIWTNQRANLTNPPQKFIMLGKHLVVC